MADEVINFENTAPVRNSGKKRKKKRAHPWAFPLGLVIALLSLIGLVTVILTGIGTVSYISYQAKNIDEYNKMLIPVVMNDPDIFDDITKADMNQLLDISIWSILKSDLSPDDYEYVDGNMIIPEEDVTAEYTKLFGSDLPPVHATVAGFGYDFVYNSAEKHYVIPLTGIEPTYTPSVTDVDKKSNTVVLTVAYLASDGWAQSADGSMVAPEPDKFVKITSHTSATSSIYTSQTALPNGVSLELASIISASFNHALKPSSCGFAKLLFPQNSSPNSTNSCSQASRRPKVL